MVLKSVGVLSVGKIMGVLYAVMGFIIGCFMSLAAVAGVAANQGPNANAGMGIMALGAGAIILAPIMYGGMGFIGGIISAALYNLLAGVIGGIEMNFDSSYDDVAAPQPQQNW
jgi:hypothetical protein